jgi:tetrahydromethanopterin S-methyltransferase subunit G
MPTYVTREEFEAFKLELVGEVEGEKLVTRHILEQAQRNGDDLGTIKSRLDRVETRLDHIAGDTVVMKADLGRHGRMLEVLRQDVREIRTRLDGMDAKLDAVLTAVRALAPREPQ